MKLRVLSILFAIGFYISSNAQTNENGVASFDIPARNSLKFNRFLTNPSFSFIREDESFISFYNKRQWVGFEDAPTSYFFSYSGKFRDQNGLGLGAFQQKFGVQTLFGVVGNFARNVELNRDSNFTFGLNLAYINSGINTGAVNSNTPETLLNNVPKFSLISVNPGINYSTGFFDLGLTANNIFYYNFNPSGLVEEDPAKNIAAHAMYTGFYDGGGFLENSKFSAILRSEIGKENTNFSGGVLFNAPKAGWAQVGYHSLNGVSAGIGFTLAKKFAIGYSIEKGLGNFTDFGYSHEITLAYKLRGYGAYEDEKPIVRATKKTNPTGANKAVAVKRKTPQELAKERAAALALKQQQEKERLEAERLQREKDLAEASARKAEADRIAREQAEAEKLRLAQEAINNKAKADAEAKARLEAEQERIAREKLEAQRLADAKAKELEAARIKAEQDRLAREKAEADRLAKAQSEAERIRLAKEAAEAKAKADAEAKARAEEAARLKAEQERIAREKLEAQRLAEAKAKADEAARLKAEQDRLAREKAEADRIAREQAEAERLRLAKEAADAKSKADAEAKAKADEAARLKAEQDRLAREKAEADRIAREQAEAERLRLAKEAADAKAKADAEAKARAEEAARLKAEQERLAKEKADAERIAREQAEAAERARLEALKTAEDKEIDNLSGVIADSQKLQSQSITKFQNLVSDKEKELLELRKANDDSEKGIVTEVKEVEFQSTAAANRAIESLKNEIALNIKQQDQFIKEYETLAAERLKKVPNKNDLVNLNYAKTIEKLKLDRQLSERQSNELISKLEQIKVETEVEKKRRIKRALFDNAQAKYQKDRATLSQIKASTTPTGQVYKPEDFDYGDGDQTNMQIVKNIENAKPGFYLVYGAHKDEARRDAFLKKLIQAGETNIDFFYDVSTGNYYIYSKQYDEISEADNAMKAKGTKPYNGKMVVIKIEK